MNKVNTLLIGFILGYFVTSAQDNQSAINFESSYVGDMVCNFTGGINTGATYLGMIDIVATVTTQNMGLWNNGEIYFQLQNTHGGSPSADYVGDFQTLSNIENGDFTYLYQFWYRHSIGKLTITTGIHDLNSEFMASNLSGEYINSSFGIMPVASLNVPISIFPKNSLATIIKYNYSNKLGFQLGIYDGDPLSLDDDRYNTHFKLGFDEGFLSVFETCINSPANINGNYKIGGFYHSGEFGEYKDTTITSKGNYGIYLIAEQTVYTITDEKNIGLFGQIGHSTKNKSFNNLYWSFGVNFNGLIRGREADIAGIAISNAFLSSYYVDMNNGMLENYESATEIFYKLNISDSFTFQPELQYIINPGAQANLNNSLVGLLRTYITF